MCASYLKRFLAGSSSQGFSDESASTQKFIRTKLWHVLIMAYQKSGRQISACLKSVMYVVYLHQQGLCRQTLFPRYELQTGRSCVDCLEAISLWTIFTLEPWLGQWILADFSCQGSPRLNFRKWGFHSLTTRAVTRPNRFRKLALINDAPSLTSSRGALISKTLDTWRLKCRSGGRLQVPSIGAKKTITMCPT